MKKKHKVHLTRTKKGWTSIILLAILICAMYVLMLPEGAVRFAILRSGHPLAALTIQMTSEEYPNELEDGQIGYTLTDAPYDRNEGRTMKNWLVYRYGMIYVGEYDDR